MRKLKIIFNSQNKKGRGCRIRNGNSGTVSDYLYDGNSLRVVKDSDGVVTHYHYDLQGRLLAETDSDGTLQRAVVWYGDTLAALIDIEQSEPTFYTCATTESFTEATGPGMTLDTVAHTVVIESGDYAGTYAISDENWQVYPSVIAFSWSGESFRFEGGLYPDYELPLRSGAMAFYQDDDEGNSQIADIYKVWKQSESGSSTIATPYQVHTDQIGAPVLLTDATGTAVWSAQYAPFGQATINSDVDGDGTEVVCNLRFPGQYFDAESGLHYNWHRYYEPRSGRYITLDPIGLAGGINLYAYVQNNPINSIDQAGLVREGANCPNNSNCVQDCLERECGDTYTWAASLSYISIPSAVYELYSNEVAMALKRSATSKLYSDTAYRAGKRQMKTLAQFSRFNNMMLVAGVGATSFQVIAYIYCQVSCAVK